MLSVHIPPITLHIILIYARHANQYLETRFVHTFVHHDHTHTRVTYLNKVIRTLFHFTK